LHKIKVLCIRRLLAISSELIEVSGRQVGCLILEVVLWVTTTMALLVRAALEGLLESAMISMALDIVRFVLVENFLKGLDRLLAVLVKPVFSALRMRAVHVSLAL
jgi:hypothetical protein